MANKVLTHDAAMAQDAAFREALPEAKLLSDKVLPPKIGNAGWNWIQADSGEYLSMVSDYAVIPMHGGSYRVEHYTGESVAQNLVLEDALRVSELLTRQFVKRCIKKGKK